MSKHDYGGDQALEEYEDETGYAAKLHAAWREIDQLKAELDEAKRVGMTSLTEAELKDLLTIYRHDADAFRNGKFLLDMEQCNEDGLVCPTGVINWLDEKSGPEDNPIVEVCDIDPDDAEIMVDAIYDRRRLLEFVMYFKGGLK